MNYYEEIRKIRNEKFPPVLEKGCELISKKTEKVYQYHSETSPDYDDSSSNYILVPINESEHLMNILDVIVIHESQLYDDDIEEFKNLGKPVSLNDVLRLVKMKYSDKIIGDADTNLVYNEDSIEIEFDSYNKKYDYALIEILLEKEISKQPEVCSEIIKLLTI